MVFKKILNLFDLKSEVAKRFEAKGADKNSARKYAFGMSPGDISQVEKDLIRAPLIIIHDESNDKTTEIRNFKEFQFDEDHPLNLEDKTNMFLDQLSQNPQIRGYLEKYFQQGGFMNTAELLLKGFFQFEESSENQVLIDSDNRESKFTRLEDGSLIYEETFAIQSMKTTDGRAYEADSGPIATISMKSKISLDQGRLHHDFKDVQINAHDPASKKLFEDPKGPFKRLIEWLKEKAQALLSKSARKHQSKIREMPSPRQKL